MPLHNVLCDTIKLDSHVIQDLLTITEVGLERTKTFVSEYVLPSPQPGPRKQRKRTRKLATFTRSSVTASESKKRENELTDIAKNAMTILQENGTTAQTCSYPLAIADFCGQMRSSSKSQFLKTLVNAFSSTRHYLTRFRQPQTLQMICVQ